MKQLVDGLEKAGVLREAPPAAQYLKEEVASGDQGRILRAFEDVCYHRKMNEAIPALRAYLDNSAPYVRFLASEELFRVGDPSGYWVLLALVQSSVPFYVFGVDLRMQAASILGQYGEKDATNAIVDLFKTTEDGELIKVLDELDPSEAFRIIQNRGYNEDKYSLIHYGKLKATPFIPNIDATFHKTTNADVKVAAAWALATMTGDTGAIDYLVQEASSGESDPGGAHGVTESEAIECLGTIRTPAAKKALEDALDYEVRGSRVRENAIVNLIYNQGGSEKAVQSIVDQLNDPTRAKLPWDFALNVAAQLTMNPAVADAGQKYAQNDVVGNWQTYTVERRNWPVYNWIRDYVITLNDPPKIQDHGQPTGWIEPLPKEPDDVKMPEIITDQDAARFYGSVVPLPSKMVVSDPEITSLVRHPDGAPWVNAPVIFQVSNGSRLLSKVNGRGPFVDKLIVLTDSHGVAHVFLQPLPSQ